MTTPHDHTIITYLDRDAEFGVDMSFPVNSPLFRVQIRETADRRTTIWCAMGAKGLFVCPRTNTAEGWHHTGEKELELLRRVFKVPVRIGAVPDATASVPLKVSYFVGILTVEKGRLEAESCDEEFTPVHVQVFKALMRFARKAVRPASSWFQRLCARQ